MASCLFQIGDDGVLVPDILPWDAGFGATASGLAVYTTIRTVGLVEDKYPGKLGAGLKSSDYVMVRNIFTRTRHEIWATPLTAGSTPIISTLDAVQPTILLVDEKNQFGYVPVVKRMVPLGSTMLDAAGLTRQGESIIFLLRTTVLELERILSIIQSLNMRELDRALQIATDSTGREDESSDDLTQG